MYHKRDLTIILSFVLLLLSAYFFIPEQILDRTDDIYHSRFYSWIEQTRRVPYQPNLPIIYLDTDKDIPLKINRIQMPDIPLTFQMEDLRSPAHNTARIIATIHERGGSTAGRKNWKRSFTVTFKKPIQLLGLGRGRRWLLQTEHDDISLIRDRLAADLFLRLSRPGAKRFAPESRFVEVILNDDYVGVYRLEKRIDRDTLGFKRYRKDFPPYPVIYKTVNQKYPPVRLIDYGGPLAELMEFIGKSSDIEFFDRRNGIYSRIDTDNFIDYLLLYNLSRNHDGLDGSIKARDGYPGAKFIFVVWDSDKAFGNWRGTFLGRYSQDGEWIESPLSRRLMQDPYFRTLLFKRWNEIAASYWAEDDIMAMIDGYLYTIGDAFERNALRWRMHGPMHAIRGLHGVNEMRRWISHRLIYMDQKLKDIVFYMSTDDMIVPVARAADVGILPQDDIDRHIVLARSAMDADNHRMVDMLCFEIMQRHGDDSRIWNLLGSSNILRGELGKARDLFIRSIVVEPTTEALQGIIAIAQIYEKKKDYERALVLIESLISMNPEGYLKSFLFEKRQMLSRLMGKG